MLRILLLCLAAVAQASEDEVATPSCLPPERRLQRSALKSALFGLRKSRIGDIKLAEATWGSHVVMTEIFRILAEEFLGHGVTRVPVSGTTGAYTMLREQEVDVNVELWESVAPTEKKEAMLAPECISVACPRDAGPLDYAPVTRSGVYLRPSTADYAELLAKGRFYSSLESTVMPMLPSMTSMLDHCKIDETGTERCLDVVNTRCVTSAPGTSGRANATDQVECKPIAKEVANYDAGKIESMIAQGVHSCRTASVRVVRAGSICALTHAL